MTCLKKIENLFLKMSCSVIYDDRSNLYIYIYQKEYANEFPRVTQPQQACLCSREGLCCEKKISRAQQL